MAEQDDEDDRADLQVEPGTYLDGEDWWQRHYQWLSDCGYNLRDRYKPGWQPSWHTSGAPFFECVDGHPNIWSQILDSTRISDGQMVALKKVSKSTSPEEIEMTRLLSSEPFTSDPRNHCVPLYEALQVPDDPDLSIMIIPHLRSFRKPRFHTIGEGIEFFRQIFEGLQFLHNNHIAHRDCMDLNIMMDGSSMFPDGYYPVPTESDMLPDLSGAAKHFSRTERPPKYYFIDFGLSRRYNLEDGPPLEVPIWGGDKTVPEFQQSNEARDPFPTDIYYLGNVVKEHFLFPQSGFEFMKPLVDDMLQADPSKRPTIDEIVSRFEKVRKSLGYWKLSSRAVGKEEDVYLKVARAIQHFRKRVEYMLRRTPPVPIS